MNTIIAAWKQLVCGVALVACSSIAFAEPQSPVVVTSYDMTFAEGTFPSGGSWYGLYCDSMDCEVREATVRITSSSAKNVLDEDEQTDVVNVDGRPTALFHGMALEPGKVATWFRMQDPPFASRQYTSLQKLGRWTMPWGRVPLSISWVKLPDGGGLRYSLSDGSTTQFLFRTENQGHHGGDNTPIVNWVGDIDGDGKSDVLLNLPDDNCGFDERLYLSSQARDGELLHKAAQLSGRQAACGC